jgi:hypothetical protein
MAPLIENKHVQNYVPIKHKQMSFRGKFKLLNGLIFPTLTQPRISFEHAILFLHKILSKIKTNPAKHLF